MWNWRKWSNTTFDHVMTVSEELLLPLYSTIIRTCIKHMHTQGYMYVHYAHILIDKCTQTHASV